MELSYEFQRRNTIKRYRAGLVKKDDVCDAEFLLVAASDFHGHPAGYDCPICDSPRLRHVQWIYGDGLKHASGSARTPEEIARFEAQGTVFTTHLVEVCQDCHWNHLLKATTPTPEEAS
ncbi:DUF5318 family protein [Corynebacterium aquilae]|uniref:DUF5318 family protein n=1 Tax=Corynebacterium aquilae TaxID=203263 RepID=UPI003CCBF5BF